jgi:hypothetical protein
MHRSIALSVLAVVLVLTLGSCSGKEKMRDKAPADVDRKLSYYAFIEEGDIASLIVSTKAARYRDGSGFMPLEVTIANRGLRQLTLTRESFTLLDENGNRYPAASPRELLEGYEFLDFDRRNFAELESIVFNRFGAFRKYPAKFSPSQQAIPGADNIVRDLVSLPKFGYLIDWIYFPEPPGGIKGHKFELFMDARELEDPIFIKFRVE